MADADDVRRLALALPGVEEIDSDGFDFRVGNKGFVWSYPERRPGSAAVIRTDIAVLYVGDEAEKQALLLGEPELFFTTPAYDGWPLVMLRLERGRRRPARRARHRRLADARPGRAARRLSAPTPYRRSRSGVGVAHRLERPPRQVLAVVHPARRRAADVAGGTVDGIVAEAHGHPLVEDVEVTLPEPAVAPLLAVAHDAAVELVDLVEATSRA